MIHIPAGSFLLGGMHLVQVPSFYLAETPVTNQQYRAFCEETQSHFPRWLEPGSEYYVYGSSNDHYKDFIEYDQPLVGISWHDAVAYCEWLSAETGDRYRLPSEAEWEYAARGGQLSQGFEYAGSNKLKEVGWYNKNSHNTTAPVGLKLPNELGLYDMSGNVWEWCADHWQDDRAKIPRDGSAWVDAKDDAGRRVDRGGSWINNNNFCRV